MVIAGFVESSLKGRGRKVTSLLWQIRVRFIRGFLESKHRFGRQHCSSRVRVLRSNFVSKIANFASSANRLGREGQHDHFQELLLDDSWEGLLKMATTGSGRCISIDR